MNTRSARKKLEFHPDIEATCRKNRKNQKKQSTSNMAANNDEVNQLRNRLAAAEAELSRQREPPPEIDPPILDGFKPTTGLTIRGNRGS